MSMAWRVRERGLWESLERLGVSGRTVENGFKGRNSTQGLTVERDLMIYALQLEPLCEACCLNACLPHRGKKYPSPLIYLMKTFHFVASSAGPCDALAQLFPLLPSFFFLKPQNRPTQTKACPKRDNDETVHIKLGPCENFTQSGICLHVREIGIRL